MFSIPEIVLLALCLTSLLIAANKHGKTKTETGNFWSSLIAVFINLGLLYWAGLFHGAQ